MNTDTSSMPSQDERITAALSHVSAILPIWGLIVPIIIWATQREKSAYVRFQSLQALVFQVLMVLAAIVGWGGYILSFLGVFAFISFSTPSRGDEVPPLFLVSFFIPFCILGMMLIGGFALILYSLIGSVMTLQGKDFHYFIIGSRLERFLQNK
jgi:uncharacterized Tic20 family protein